MKTILTFLLSTVLLTIVCAQTPPYSGTIFIDPDIITSTDPTATPSTTYTGQGSVTMYDRRVNNWVTVNAYLFNVIWSDGITSRAQVNPEFGSVALATVEAQKYASLIGQLPACLRQDVNEIWIHKGTQPFGGGNNSILIHTGQSTLYENDGIIEETLVHEASHTSLDAAHASATGWTNAQTADNNFISTYARDNRTREDIAESFLTWFAIRYRRSRISVATYNTITQTIPNRLKYFDGINCNLSPLLSVDNTDEKTKVGEFYPNPAKFKLVNLDYTSFNDNEIRVTVFDLSGKLIIKQTKSLHKGNNSLSFDFSLINRGMYIVKIETDKYFLCKKMILE
jgi:Secretion system C-terminal sorting domain